VKTTQTSKKKPAKKQAQPTDKKIMEVSNSILRRNIDAYKELAKK